MSVLNYIHKLKARAINMFGFLLLPTHRYYHKESSKVKPYPIHPNVDLHPPQQHSSHNEVRAGMQLIARKEPHNFRFN
jgi:hypothetical protein